MRTITWPIIPVILCGGAGSRLWPASRQLKPKPFIKLTPDSDTLLERTLQRVSQIAAFSAPIIVCNQEYRFLVAQVCQEQKISNKCILLEPVAKNTAAAIALAAHEADKDAILVVMPADHLIDDIKKFSQTLNNAFQQADQGYLVTLGVQPTRAETGYGYIKQGEKIATDAYKLAEFIEKPNQQRAIQFLADKKYLWNAGIFVFKAENILTELTCYEPEIVKHTKSALKHATTDLDFKRIAEEAFDQCPSVSIDVAVMEKTKKAAVVSYMGEWSDIGSWLSLWESGEKDASGNVIAGDVVLNNVKNSYVYSDKQLVVVANVDNLAIVAYQDALLVIDKKKTQEVRLIVDQLQSLGREEVISHPTVYRPWGSFSTLITGKNYKVKQIIVKPGAGLSLQKHQHRAEHWVVVHGQASIVCGGEKKTLNENESTYIPIGTVHRLANKTEQNLEIIEVQTGEHLDENDIIRLDDHYGRD